MIEIIVLVPVLSLSLWLLFWYCKVAYYEKYLKTIPGPRRVPLLGNALVFAKSSSYHEVPIEYAKKFKGTFKLYLGTHPVLLITNPEDVKFLLKSNTIIAKASSYKYLRVGDGVLTTKGEKWRKLRRIAALGFHMSRLEKFIDVFNSHSETLVSKLAKFSGKGAFDIHNLLGCCTIDILSETGTGTSMNAQSEGGSPIMKWIYDRLKVVAVRSSSYFLWNDFIFRFSKLWRLERMTVKLGNELRKIIVDQRRRELADDLKHQDEEVFTERKKKSPFLDVLLEQSFRDPTFTEQDIHDNVDTFVAAGFDTVTTTLSFTIFLLAKYPDIQRKAFAEIETILGKDAKRSMTLHDLQEMKYLEMVIKESLRLYPPAPFIGRVLEEDTDWNGTILPKGLDLWLFVYGIHHSEIIYEDPEKFDPERFNPEHFSEKDVYSFLPFSAGPRNCVGKKFAMLEMKTIISSILRNYELYAVVPEHKMEISANVVLCSENGYPIQIKDRN